MGMLNTCGRWHLVVVKPGSGGLASMMFVPRSEILKLGTEG